MKGALALLVGLVGCGEAQMPGTHEPLRPPEGDVICPIGGCVAVAPRNVSAPSSKACGDIPECAAEVLHACDDTHAKKCAQAALSIWSRDDADVSRVYALFERACALHDGDSCFYAGRLALDGKGVVKNTTRAVELLESACESDIARACAALARHLTAEAKHHNAPEQGPHTAERFGWQTQCLEGTAQACFYLGLHFETGTEGYAKDMARAASMYEKGCAGGNMPSCNNLGNLRLYGDGVAKDPAKSADLFDRACRGFELNACANLGFLSEYGDGVAKDLVRAEDLYSRACTGGRAYGCVHLAMLDEYKRGAPRDPSQAAAKWQQACDKNDGRACSFLAILVEDGKGVSRDENRAAELMRKACRVGEPQSCKWIRDHAR